MNDYSVLHYPDLDAFDKYYDLVEFYGDGECIDKNTLRFLEIKLNDLVSEDPHYYDPKNLLAIVYADLGKRELSLEILEDSYEEILLLLKEKKIKKLSYYIIENRHIFRILYTYFLFLWIDDCFETAEKVYRTIKKIDDSNVFYDKDIHKAVKDKISYNDFFGTDSIQES